VPVTVVSGSGGSVSRRWTSVPVRETVRWRAGVARRTVPAGVARRVSANMPGQTGTAKVRKPSTSSMPSSASSSDTGAGGVPAASSASTRWIRVSCGIRRYQNPTVWSGSYQVGEGSPGSRRSSSATSAA
jgi:hypothetical protein